MWHCRGPQVEAELSHSRTSESAAGSEWEWLGEEGVLDFYRQNAEKSRMAIAAALAEGRWMTDPNLPGQDVKLYKLHTKRKASTLDKTAGALGQQRGPHGCCVLRWFQRLGPPTLRASLPHVQLSAFYSGDRASFPRLRASFWFNDGSDPLSFTLLILPTTFLVSILVSGVR